MVKAMFPGSFDPLTNGHLNIIERASQMFDQLSIVIGNNTSKNALFTPVQRQRLVQQCVKNFKNVDVVIADGLMVKFAQQINAKVMVRGLRNVNDLEYEKSIATLNHNLDDRIETICLLTAPQYAAISSSMLKEIFHFDGNISNYVPEPVLEAMLQQKGS